MSNQDRRLFLKSAAGAGLAASIPYYFSDSTTFASEFENDRTPIGLIGSGGMGMGNIDSAKEWVNLVAIADADEGNAGKANRKFSEGKADVYNCLLYTSDAADE